MNRYRSLIPVWMMAAMVGGAVLTGVSGCAKKEEPIIRSYKISGTVYYDCAKKPYAGQLLELIHYTSTTADASIEGIETVTDNFGRFSFIYTDGKGDGYFTNEYQILAKNFNGEEKLLISRIPASDNLDVGELFVANKFNLFVDVKVGLKKSAMADTLFFGVSEAEYHYIIPIVSTAGVYEFNAPARLYQNDKPFTTSSFFFAIGRQAYNNSFSAMSDQSIQASYLVYESEYFVGLDCAQAQRVDTVRVEL